MKEAMLDEKCVDAKERWDRIRNAPVPTRAIFIHDPRHKRMSENAWRPVSDYAFEAFLNARRAEDTQ